MPRSSDADSLCLARLTEPAILANPYPFYQRLRREAPVHFDAGSNAWLVSRYADVVSVLRDSRFHRKRDQIPIEDAAPAHVHGPLRALSGAFTRQMLFVDPPAHTRLRGLVSRAFTPRMVAAMTGRIRALVETLLSAAAATRRIDLIRDLARPLPFTIIREMLGLPAGDEERLLAWSTDYANFLGNIPPALEQLVRAGQAVIELGDHLRPLLRQRRASPRDDLLTALVLAEEQGSVLGEEELVANVLLLLLAGHETTTGLIGSGVLALLQNPDQKQMLDRAPELHASAVEELLRYTSPIQFTAAIAREPVTIAGQPLAAGQSVLLMLAAANRDPDQWPEPERLDITRRQNRHLAFGHGPHYCLGAALARLECEIALRAIFEMMPHARVDCDALEWQLSMGFRGLKALPIAF